MSGMRFPAKLVRKKKMKARANRGSRKKSARKELRR